MTAQYSEISGIILCMCERNVASSTNCCSRFESWTVVEIIILEI